MRIFNWILIVFSLTPFRGWAQNSSISGNATDWAGKVVRLIDYTDPISQNQVILDMDTVGKDGVFQLRFSVEKPSALVLAVNRFTAPIYAEPNASYVLAVPPIPESRLIQTWQPGTFDYAFLSIDSTDVNQKIAEFDRDYYNFFIANSTLIGRPEIKEKIKRFEARYFSEIKNAEPYFRNYVYYSLGEMKLSNGFPRLQLFQTYFENEEIQLENPAWYSIFNLFFADYFNEFDVRFGGENLANQLRKGLTPYGLDTLLLRDDFLQDDTLRQLVILKSVHESFYDGNFEKGPLISVVEFIDKNPASHEVKAVASNLLKKLKRELLPRRFESIAGGDSLRINQEIPVLLMVTASWSTESKREKAILNQLMDEYGDVFQVLEVGLDYEKLPGEEWMVIKPDDAYAFMNEFEVYSIPRFYWLESDGKIFDPSVKKPSEGLEERLYKLKSLKREADKIRIGR